MAWAFDIYHYITNDKSMATCIMLSKWLNQWVNGLRLEYSVINQALI